MQIIPPTAAGRRLVELRTPTRKSMLQPNLNIRLGSRYLAYLLKRYRGRVAHAIAAYNAGPLPTAGSVVTRTVLSMNG